MHKNYINGENYLWLLKCTGFNRGRGIQIFNNMDQCIENIFEYYNG